MHIRTYKHTYIQIHKYTHTCTRVTRQCNYERTTTYMHVCKKTYTLTLTFPFLSTQDDGNEPGLATDAPTARATPGPLGAFANVEWLGIRMYSFFRTRLHDFSLAASKNRRYVKASFTTMHQKAAATTAQPQTRTFHPFPALKQTSVLHRERDPYTWTMKPRSIQGEIHTT